MQEDEAGIDHPVSFFFFSKKFSQQNDSLLLALQHLEVYLGGSDGPIMVYIDHNPLVFLKCMCNTNHQLMIL